jgi:hypothetical protein
MMARKYPEWRQDTKTGLFETGRYPMKMLYRNDINKIVNDGRLKVDDLSKIRTLLTPFKRGRR